MFSDTNTMHSSFDPDFVASTPSAPPARATIPDIVRPLPPNSSGENLRTGATMVPYSSNQSLHSQVLRNITAYPPEPRIPASSSSFTISSSGTSQPDLVQSPLEGPGAIPKTSAVTDVVNTVAGLKISDGGNVPPSDAQVTSVSVFIFVGFEDVRFLIRGSTLERCVSVVHPNVYSDELSRDD